MLTGIPLLIVFVLSIILMILAISKLKIHPFLSIIGTSLILALLAIPDITTIPDIIGAGFSGTFTSIGIVIIFGALIGLLLEKTGAALKIADSVVKLIGSKHPETALLLMGWIVSIPVFCDSGFVILNPVRNALVQRTKKSSVACTVALSMGLYISHCFIPPSPGPIAAANTLWKDGLGISDSNLLLVMGIGALCSILPLIAAYFFSIFIGKRVKSADETCNNETITQTYEELVESYGRLPNIWFSLSPILVPILLMAIPCILTMTRTSLPIFVFLGKPIIALAVGVILGVLLLVSAKKTDNFYELTNDTLKTCGPILFVTAAGGVLGKVIASSDLLTFISANANALTTLGYLFPFLLAALLKTAQGSSTVAITTTASIVAPLMSVLGWSTPISAALLVVSIGAGSMVVAHANDSYFWVVTSLGEIKMQDGYKSFTLCTLIVGLAALLNVLIVSIIFH